MNTLVFFIISDFLISVPLRLKFIPFILKKLVNYKVIVLKFGIGAANTESW